MKKNDIIKIIIFISIILIISFGILIYSGINAKDSQENKALQTDRIRTMKSIVENNIPEKCNGYIIQPNLIKLNCSSLNEIQKEILELKIENEISNSIIEKIKVFVE